MPHTKNKPAAVTIAAIVLAHTHTACTTSPAFKASAKIDAASTPDKLPPYAADDTQHTPDTTPPQPPR